MIAALRRDPEFWRKLEPAAKVMLAARFRYFARPEQIIPRHAWRTFGLDGARGLGKTTCVASEINASVEAGLESCIGLMAPSELRVHEVQIAALVATAPPWFVPEVRKQQLVWPNGVAAMIFTPGAPDAPRGGNFSTAWATEIVAWPQSTAVDAWNNLTTATRAGRKRVLWDSTNKGRNAVLESLRAANQRDPRENIIVGGTIFDAMHYDPVYLRAEWNKYTGVRRDEELLGRHFAQAAGALWSQTTIDRLRVAVAPALVLEHVGIDPGFGVGEKNDMTGLHRAGLGVDGHVYLLEDRTGHHEPEAWGRIAIDWMPRGGRSTLETNQGGNLNVGPMRSAAKDRGLRVVTIGREDDWPPADEGVVFVREVHSRENKGTRADGPAAETEAGRVHVVGELPDLELEMTTYEPGGTRKSPNRLDVAVFCITELAALNAGSADDPAGDMRAWASALKQLGARPARGRAPGSWITGGGWSGTRF